MNSSSKQILALWLQKKEGNWSYKTVRDKILNAYSKLLTFLQCTNVQDCGVYHYKTKSGYFKSSVVIKINNDLSEIIKILLLFQVRSLYNKKFGNNAYISCLLGKK